MIKVEVAYANPEEQNLLTLDLPEKTTIKEAIKKSGILDHFPEIDLNQNKVGIFGNVKDLETTLRDKDRVEIYRPLKIDPKQARKLKTLKGSS